MKIKTKWLGNMKFEAENSLARSANMDGHKELGGEDTAQSPMEMLLSSLTGCMGINIVQILRKYPMKNLAIEVEGERNDQWPKEFTHIQMAFTLEGDIPERLVKRAVEMSHEKYCSVSNSIKAEVSNEIILNGEKLALE